MSTTHDVPARLRELERVLAESRDAFAAMRAGSDASSVHHVPAERIRLQAAMLRSYTGDHDDAVGTLAARLLLQDCAAAVGVLRSVAREAADRLDAAAVSLKLCHKQLWREHKMVAKETGPVEGGASPEDDPAVALAMVPAWRRLWTNPRGDAAAGLRLARFRCLTAPRRMRWLEGLEVLLVPGERISQAVYVSGLFEPCTAVVLRALLREGDTFVDVGANVGLLSMLASRWVGPSGLIVSFEPSAREFGRLRDHVERNALGNVRPVGTALGDRGGSAVLRIADARHGGHNTLAERFVHETAREVGTETVPLERLDDYVSRHGLARVHVIKIDVAGGEPGVIAGADATLARDTPALVLGVSGAAAEPGHEGRLALEARLRALGYVFVAIDAERAMLRHVHDLAGPAENVLAAPGPIVDALARQVPIAGLAPRSA